MDLTEKNVRLRGLRAKRKGLRMARKLGTNGLNAPVLCARSNACRYRGQSAVIKTASIGNRIVNVTQAMLPRLDAVIAAFQAPSGEYDVWMLALCRDSAKYLKRHTRLDQFQIDLAAFRQSGEYVGRFDGQGRPVRRRPATLSAKGKRSGQP